MSNTMAVILLLSLLVIALGGLVLYLITRRRNHLENENKESPESYSVTADETADSTDSAVESLPEVQEIDSQTLVDSNYRKFPIPDTMVDLVRQTVHIGYPVLKDMKSYKVQFSKETMAGLKAGTMQLAARKGEPRKYTPMAVMKGNPKFKEQAALVKKLDPVLLANASLNLLTAAVGQQQLATMQKSLDRLAVKTELLLAYNNDEYTGRAQARIGYMAVVTERMEKKGVVLNGPEDIQVENTYKETLEDIATLHNQQKTIVSRIETIKDREIIRGFKDAKYMASLQEWLDEFKEKQQIIELNFQFIKEYYDPYLMQFRGYKKSELNTSAIQSIEQTSHNLLNRILDKVQALETDYRVVIGLKKDKYKEENISRAKELVPAELSYQPAQETTIPDTMIIGTDETGKPYAYLPEE